jgi:hypothetical protein
MPLRCVARYRVSDRSTTIIEVVDAEDAGNRSHFGVDGSTLLYRSLGVKKFEEEILVSNGRLYVLGDGLEVYELPHTDRLRSESGDDCVEYRQRRLVLNGTKSLRCETEPHEVILAERAVYVLRAGSLLVLDRDLNEVWVLSFSRYCYSGKCFMIEEDDGAFLVEEDKRHPVDLHLFSNSSSLADVLAFARCSGSLYVWSIYSHALCMGTYEMREGAFAYESFCLYSARGSSPVLSIQDIILCTDPNIHNPLRAGCRTVNGALLLLAATKSRIFMEYGGICAHKPYVGHVYEIDMDVYKIHLLDSTMSLHDLYLTLYMRTGLPAPSDVSEVEAFLFRLFLFTDHGMELASKLYRDWNIAGEETRSSLELVLYRLYRKVDDRGKRVLSQIISGISGMRHMKAVIIYFPEKLEDYLNYCIDESMEYEIEEIIEHYRGSSHLSAVAEVLLHRNCFYLFCLCRPEFCGRFKLIAEVEKYNIKTQRGMRREDLLRTCY